MFWSQNGLWQITVLADGLVFLSEAFSQASPKPLEGGFSEVDDWL
jgi:hypothetical protein